MPGLAAVGRAEPRRIFRPGLNDIGFRERWLQMPNSFELPGMLCAVVPLVGRKRLAGLGGNVIDELIAFTLGHPLRRLGFFGWRPRLIPGFAAVIRSLDDLPEPAAGLRGVESIGVDGRTLQMVHLPAREMGTTNSQPLTSAARCEDERPLLGTHQNPYSAHRFLLLEFAVTFGRDPIRLSQPQMIFVRYLFIN